MLLPYEPLAVHLYPLYPFMYKKLVNISHAFFFFFEFRELLEQTIKPDGTPNL